VAELTTRRVILPDIRGNDQHLRATWHPDTLVVVVSHWVGDVCVASTPVGVAEVSNLIGLLVSALQDSATRSLEPLVTSPATRASWTSMTLQRVRRRFQPTLAQVIALHRPNAGRGGTSDPSTGGPSSGGPSTGGRSAGGPSTGGAGRLAASREGTAGHVG
jgi:uncharacterized membrane protein YgcG